MRNNLERLDQLRLVNIPVGLSPATAPSRAQSDVQFRMLHRECLNPIKQKRWCPFHDVEVGPDEIVRGWEVAKGQFVPSRTRSSRRSSSAARRTRSTSSAS
jgi:non-homologous end joining protein Ku